MSWLQQFESDVDVVDVRLVEIESDEGPIDGKYVHRTYRLEVSLTESPELERKSGQLRVFAVEADDPVATIPLLIDPARPVEVFPRALYVTGGEFPRQYRLVVRAEPGFSLEVTPKGTLPEWVQIEPAQAANEAWREFRVTLQAPPEEIDKSPGTLHQTEIVLTTNHPQASELSLPLLYRRLDSR